MLRTTTILAAGLLVAATAEAGRKDAPRTPMETGACAAAGALPATSRVPGLGDGNPLHLHVIGAMHPSVESRRHARSITRCQARIHETILELAREHEVRMVAAEGVAWMAPAPDRWTDRRTVCEELERDRGTTATHLLSLDDPAITVVGWEDPFLHAMGLHHARRKGKLRRWKMDRLDELADAVDQAEDTGRRVEELLAEVLVHAPHLASSEAEVVGEVVQLVHGAGSDELRRFEEARERTTTEGRPDDLATRVRRLRALATDWQGRTAAAEADLAALEGLSRSADASQDWSEAVLGPNAIARSAAAVANTVGAMEIEGEHTAVLVIGAGHLDDLLEMRRVASSWPGMTLYSCGATDPALMTLDPGSSAEDASP